MFKKMFALASVTALMGVVSTMAAAGCSSTTTSAAEDGGTAVGDGGKEGKAPTEGGPIEDEDASGPAEEGTVGKACTDTKDCNVADSVNDNVCTAGAFTPGDLWSTSVCIQPQCKQGSGNTVGDLLCDGNAGLCLPTSAGSKAGICVPFCDFDSTKVTTVCLGNNKCNLAYSATKTDMTVGGIGSCLGACQADADCKGTAGQKCQVETGLCYNADKVVVFPKAYGAGCTVPPNATDPDECNCNNVGGTGADAAKGVCTRQCITGAAGNTACGAAVTGWTCTARLPVMDTMGKALFTGQPDDLSGICALPCVDDTTCAPLQTATGAPLKCKEFASGKWCETTDT
jgi:hypothetical protein